MTSPVALAAPASVTSAVPVDAVMPTYRRAPVAFVRGQGTRLFDATGRGWLDFAAGIAVCSLGHADPRLVAALTGQAQRLWHCSNLFEMPGQQAVAARLAALGAGELVFFANSGAEANECAIKVARRHHAAADRPQRWRILGFEGSFHGRTLATLAAAGNAANLDRFGPPVAGFDQVPFGDLDAAARAVTPETAAILVEPIQGDGGIRTAPDGFLAGLRALANRHGLLLIVDEIQTGLGRTGALFASHAAGVTPDVVTLAKGLGGGFPVGACVSTRHAAGAMLAGSHGSTFGGNPLAMSVVGAVLDVVTAPDFLAGVQRAGMALTQALDALVARHPAVCLERRGVGLMQGLRTVLPPAELAGRLLQAGLVVAPAHDGVVRLLPPLTVTPAEIAEAAALLEDVVGGVAAAG